MRKTRLAQDRAVADVPDENKVFRAGEDTIARGGVRLTPEAHNLLWLEYQEIIAARDVGDQIRRTLAVWGMFVAIFTLCGVFHPGTRA